MLTKTDLNQISKVVNQSIQKLTPKIVNKAIQEQTPKIVQKEITGFRSEIRKEFKIVKKDISTIKRDMSKVRRDLNTVIDVFDRDIIELRSRVDRIDQFLKLPPVVDL